MTMTLPQALDTDLLRAFVLIAEGHSFTQAAARVGRTQSAVSMQVKRLEEQLGQPVLSRSKGGSVELTPHGHYLLTRARQILALNDEVLTTFRTPQIAGTVRLGTPDDYAFAYLPPILKRFAETHPAVQVDVVCSPSGELMRRLKADELDLTLISDGHQPAGWPAVPLWRGPLVWVTSTRFAPHRQDPLPLALADRQAVPGARAGLRMGGCRGACAGAGRPALSHRLHLGLADRHACAGAGGTGGHRVDLVLAAGRAAPDAARGGTAEAAGVRHPAAEGQATAAAGDRCAGGAYRGELRAGRGSVGRGGIGGRRSGTLTRTLCAATSPTEWERQ